MKKQDLFGVVSDLALAVQAVSVYPDTHQRVQELLTRLHQRIKDETERLKTLHMGFMGDHAIVDEFPFLGLSPTLIKLIRRMQERGIEKVSFGEGITFGELKRFVYYVGGGKEGAAEMRWEHITCGRIHEIAEGGNIPSGLSPVMRSHVLQGAAEVLKSLLTSLAGEGAGGRVSEGRDLVAAVMKGLRQEGMLVDRLMRLQAHDDYTVTHSLNVCVIVVAQAIHLGFSEPQVQELGMAALLHDVGKETIPQEILNKPGRLDAGEFERMAEHPTTGAKILRKLDCGSDLPMIVAFEHHVKYDRSGYPAVRFEGAMQPASYMTQIADVYDALRTYRPYRKSLDRETTISIMKEGRGKEFEPRLFDRFLELLP
ncbi:MAG TPA: HD domain-containing phosphohydrolase [Candidatus Deferrimicrobiaceae bacterium]|jgi:putative nucleotidyltransferase with HDIG domain